MYLYNTYTHTYIHTKHMESIIDVFWGSFEQPIFLANLNEFENV